MLLRLLEIPPFLTKGTTMIVMGISCEACGAHVIDSVSSCPSCGVQYTGNVAAIAEAHHNEKMRLVGNFDPATSNIEDDVNWLAITSLGLASIAKAGIPVNLETLPELFSGKTNE